MAPAPARLALAALCAVLFLTFLDNTIVSVALADMQKSLLAGVSSLQWIVDGYMLAFAGLLLVGGTLGDLFGRKKVMLGGVGLFCAGSLLGALAHGTSTLIAGRVVMGVGAAACEPGTLSLIRQIYREERARARALGVWTSVSGVSLAAGPVLGGLLVAAWGWRGVFWFNLGFGLVALAVAAWALPESSDPQGRSLDLPGLVTGVVAVSALTFAVIGGENAGFTTLWIDGLFALAAAATVLFVVIERRARDPVLPLAYFRIPAYSTANAVAFATSFGLFAVFFFTALYLQVDAKYSGGRIAEEFGAMALAMVAAGWVSGRWTSARGPRWPMTIGCLLSGAGIVLVDRILAVNVSKLELAAALALVGFGLGLTLVAVTSAVLTIAPAERSGMAASTVNTSRELGGVLAVAILGAVINGRLVSELNGKLGALGVGPELQQLVVHAVTHGGLPADATLAILTNPVVAANPGVIPKILDAAETAFGHALHSGLLVAAIVLFAAAVGSFVGAAKVAPAAR